MKTKIKLKNFYLIFIFLTFVFLSFYLNQAYAVNMESPRFKIQFGDINIGAIDSSSNSYNLSTTLGQTAAGEFSRDGYVVKAGFQYIHSIIPFAFSVSNTNINLGTLSPDTPNTVTTKLKVSFGKAGGYQVTASETGPLQTLSGIDSIPDVNCGEGNNACDEDNAKPWTSNSSYGFGYNVSCNGIDSSIPCFSAIPPAFKICGGDDCPTYYRRFADTLQSEIPSVIMASPNVTIYTPTPYPDAVNRNTNQTTLTFKANINSMQPAGTYQTVINLTAIPGF